MSPTLDFEYICLGVGVILAIVAIALHSVDLGLAGTSIALLSGYAAWLDGRR